MLLPIIVVVFLGYAIIKLFELLPAILDWYNRPKLKNEYNERRRNAILSCPVQLKNKELILHYDNSSLLRSNLGKIMGYSTIPSNSIIMPDDPKKAKHMPTNLRLMFYIPNDLAFFYNLSFGMFPDWVMDLIFTDDQIKDSTKEAVILKGNSIEPMIGGAYHLLVSQNTPVYNLDNSLKIMEVTKLNSEFARITKDVAENALRLNPAHTASLEREGGEAEVPVNSPLPSNMQNKQGGQ